MASLKDILTTKNISFFRYGLNLIINVLSPDDGIISKTCRYITKGLINYFFDFTEESCLFQDFYCCIELLKYMKIFFLCLSNLFN